MKKTILILMAILISIACNAQRSYQEAITMADEALRKGDYKRAYDLYWSAEAFDDTKKDVVRKKINSVFDKINNLRTEAEKAKQLALENEEKATKSYHQAELMRKNAEYARANAMQNEEVAKKNELEAIKSNQLSSFFIALSFEYLSKENLLEDFLIWIRTQKLEGQLNQALKIFIERSKSIDREEEKRSWVSLLTLMDDDQKIKLLKILTNEMSKLQFIQWKYEEKKDSIKNIYLNKWISEGFIKQGTDTVQDGKINTKIPETSYERGLSSYEKDYIIKLLTTESDSNNYIAWFQLSWASLLANKPEVAIHAAKKTLELNSEAKGVEGNLALGYLLTNNWGKAEQVYRKWKGKRFPDFQENLSDFYFLADIADLEKAGISHPDFEKARNLFLD